MSSATIAKTRDGFSSIVGQLQRGEISEHLVMNRNKPVVRMIPIEAEDEASNRIGAAKGEWGEFDYEAFNALDDEVAELFGV